MAEITVTGAGGEYMESVVVVAWHKQVGDQVKQGDLIVTVETAKAATEIEATETGILTEILAQAGEEVPLGAILGHIGERLPQEASPSSGRIIASPLARRLARQQNIDLMAITPSSPTGRIKVRDLESLIDHESPPSIAIHHAGTQGKTKIVFLHGFGGDASSWNPLLAALGNQFDCYLVDLPGHGHSYLPKMGLDARRIAQDVASALLKKQLGAFHLVGHSLGGAVGLALAETALCSLSSLTLLAPVGLGAEINGVFIDGFTRANQKISLAPWLEKLFFNPQQVTPALVEATWQARRDAALREAQSLIASCLFPDGTQALNLRHMLQKIEAPQKIIWGMQDQIVPMSHAMNLGGHSALHFLPDVGHMPHYEVTLTVAHLLRQNIRCAIKGEN